MAALFPHSSFLSCSISLSVFFSIFVSLSFSTADIISTVEFNHTGELLATGDKGGRVVIFQREPEVDSHLRSYTQIYSFSSQLVMQWWRNTVPLQLQSRLIEMNSWCLRECIIISVQSLCYIISSVDPGEDDCLRSLSVTFEEVLTEILALFPSPHSHTPFLSTEQVWAILPGWIQCLQHFPEPWARVRLS